jgi:tetratricopeptide (TPR) repeat protein
MHLLLSFLVFISFTAIKFQEPGSNELAEADRATSEAAQLFSRGKFKDAVKPATRALEIRKKILGEDDPRTWSAALNLGELYYTLRDLRKADPLLTNVISGYEKLLPNDPGVIRALSGLALVKYAEGDSEHALELCSKAVALTERLYGASDTRAIQQVFNLAEFLQFEGRLTEAEPLYRRIATLRGKSNSSESPSLRDILDRYACLLRKAGRRGEAMEIEQSSTITGSASELSSEEDKKVEGNVVNGRALSLPKPAYPNEAKKVNAQGVVAVRVVISEQGDVIRACAISGPAVLAQSTERAAFASKFSPTKLNSKPVEVRGVITYTFVRY